jgi:hypothetical protein
MMARQLKPHGTNAAYQRHIKAGEDPCEACRSAHAVYSRDHRHGNIPARKPAEHGTLPGYDAHRYRKEKACQPCLDAHAAYARDRRAQARQAKAERAAALDTAWAEVLSEAGVI